MSEESLDVTQCLFHYLFICCKVVCHISLSNIKGSTLYSSLVHTLTTIKLGCLYIWRSKNTISECTAILCIFFQNNIVFWLSLSWFLLISKTFCVNHLCGDVVLMYSIISVYGSVPNMLLLSMECFPLPDICQCVIIVKFCMLHTYFCKSYHSYYMTSHEYGYF